MRDDVVDDVAESSGTALDTARIPDSEGGARSGGKIDVEDKTNTNNARQDNSTKIDEEDSATCYAREDDCLLHVQRGYDL